jgi:hypothetical protein
MKASAFKTSAAGIETIADDHLRGVSGDSLIERLGR